MIKSLETSMVYLNCEKVIFVGKKFRNGNLLYLSVYCTELVSQQPFIMLHKKCTYRVVKLLHATL